MGAPKLNAHNSLEQSEMNQKEFEYFSRRIYDLAGINLPYTAKNISLVQNRLSRLLRKYDLSGFGELVDFIKKANDSVIDEFISSLTTNKTHFFREESHFRFLENDLSAHFSKYRELRIWCAASSSGQEPYTLGIVLLENLNPAQLSRSKILATDIDVDILRRASLGEYAENEIDGLSLDLRKKYFHWNESTKKFTVTKQLRSLIDFARFNLIHGHYKFTKPFDYIFCRNVLIYFDAPTTNKVIQHLTECLRPEGYLILGHSESGTPTGSALTAVAQAVYKRRTT